MQITILEWATRNDIPPRTARKWCMRGRIKAEKVTTPIGDAWMIHPNCKPPAPHPRSRKRYRERAGAK